MPKEVYDFETGEGRPPSDLETKMIASLIGHLLKAIEPQIEKANLDITQRRAVSLNNYVIGFLKNALVIKEKDEPESV